MPYLRCGRCALQFKIQAAFMRVDNCPRCLARSATTVPLTLSPHRIAPAAGWGSPSREPENVLREANHE